MMPDRRLILVCMLLTCLSSEVSLRADDDVAVQFLQRRSQTNPDDEIAMASLADWAHTHDLSYEAMLAYRRVVELNNNDDRVYDQLIQLADSLRLPEDHQRQRKLTAEFSDQFHLHVSPHFLIIYDTDPQWAINRAVLLEKTHQIFMETFRKADLKPLPLTDRLVCLLFKSHDGFAAYAHRVDHMDMAWSSGYYSTRTNRIAFFHDQSNPAHQKVVAHIAQLESRIDELRTRIRSSANNPALVAEYRNQLDAAMREHQWYRNRLRGVAGMANTAKTTHEAVHQLAFNTRIQSRSVQYPFWLAEGLATNFESDDPAGRFGPYFDNPDRRQLLAETAQKNELMPMDEFLGLAAPPTDAPHRVSQLYAQAYGLFQFLFKKRHAQMHDYLQHLIDVKKPRRSPAEMCDEFTKYFGPIREIEQQFKTWTRQMR